jgi:hypothetical protein
MEAVTTGPSAVSTRLFFFEVRLQILNLFYIHSAPAQIQGGKWSTWEVSLQPQWCSGWLFCSGQCQWCSDWPVLLVQAKVALILCLTSCA